MTTPVFNELDEGGLPVHMPTGVTQDGQGPTNDSEAHHWVCWCSKPDCALTRALEQAGEAGARRLLDTRNLESEIAYALAIRHKCLLHAGPGSGPCRTDRERAALVMKILREKAED